MMTLMLTNPDTLVKFLPNISSNVCFMKTQMSTPFMKTIVFAARVFQATLWIFLDCQNIGASKLIFPFRKINIPVWELCLPYLHMAYQNALLIQIVAPISRNEALLCTMLVS